MTSNLCAIVVDDFYSAFRGSNPAGCPKSAAEADSEKKERDTKRLSLIPVCSPGGREPHQL
jgi:hypothetical protein